MASNSFGTHFRFTTWGESHGKAIGVVIDGCPAGIAIDEHALQLALSRRTPGQNALTSPRKEKDAADVLSGIFEGKTTGAPISIVIFNKDANSSHYEPIKHLMRPGHGNYTYLNKYGCFDYRGGGRASARETACRVAAGYFADLILEQAGIHTSAYLQAVTGYHPHPTHLDTPIFYDTVLESPLFCASKEDELAIASAVESARDAGNSLGGIIAFQAHGLPVGLGDPVYQKLEACLASAMMSIPASKGFEIGEGFQAAHMHGSNHNDAFSADEDQPLVTNHAGGTLAGISSGQLLAGRVAFKPTSSIRKTQHSITQTGKDALFSLPAGSRHDPCVAVRAAPVVKAMLSIVLADALLMNRLAKVS